MVGFIAAVTLLFVAVGATPASAQYFGRNKVQYEDFDFRILETPHFDIYYYPAEQEAVNRAAELAERWYARLSTTLDHQLRERQSIVLYASASHFAQTTIIPGLIAEGVGGVTEHQKGRIVLPFAAGLAETDHVLGHELVHAFQRDILDAAGRSMSSLPLWFLEGMAEYLTIARIDPMTAMWLRDAAADGNLPGIEDLTDPRWFPYRYGHALWSYLADRFGTDVVARCLASRASGGAMGRIAAVTGVDTGTLSKDWHDAIRAAFDDPPGSVEQAVSPARPLIGSRSGGGRLNLAPAISPDGKQVVFLSERDKYSVDLYLADASSGTIERRLIQTAASTHFDSLQFIGSAGAWSPDGGRFALAAVRDGQPVLTILAMPSGRIVQEVGLAALDEAFNPSWSPDGGRIVFSALRGGASDLYVVDLQTRKVQALTADLFADRQPAWSPDGTTIVFSTDRFTSSLDTLDMGDYRLGAMDVATGRISPLPALAGAKHVDPQWSADGESVFFVADAGERNNVFRVHLPSGQIFQVTDVRSGVSGVTATSPAISIAAGAKQIAYTVYRHGGYELHVEEARAGTRLTGPLKAADSEAAPMPAVHAPASALADDEPFTVKPYDGGLALSGIGQPYLSAGGGSFGTFVRAGIRLSFSDTLGEHGLQTLLQVGKGIDDFATQVAYVNRESRWNWGIVGEQVPALLRASRRTIDPAADGLGSTVTTSSVLLRQIHRQVNGVAIYPFSRSRRLELSAGLHTIAFGREDAVSAYSSRTGDVLFERRDESSPLAGVALVETGVALVHDSAVMGPLSPVLGERYRLEFAPTVGALSFATVTADYRRYWIPSRPFTFALRLKHVGRYGPDAGDLRLLPLGVSLRSAVRGTSQRMLAEIGCSDRAEADCAAVQYLGTRRLSMANLELRFPVVGLIRGNGSYGPLPLEGFAFADAAWLSGRAPQPGSPASRFAFQSVGAGVRVNAAGFVLELAGARPFGAAGQGWTFAVNFRPGF